MGKYLKQNFARFTRELESVSRVPCIRYILEKKVMNVKEGLVKFLAVMAVISLVASILGGLIRERDAEISMLKQQLEQANLEAGKPIHISSLVGRGYRLDHGENRKFVQTENGVVGVFSWDFRLNLPEEFCVIGGKVCDTHTAKPIDTNKSTEEPKGLWK